MNTPKVIDTGLYYHKWVVINQIQSFSIIRDELWIYMSGDTKLPANIVIKTEPFKSNALTILEAHFNIKIM